jgi:hypothetical protein
LAFFSAFIIASLGWAIVRPFLHSVIVGSTAANYHGTTQAAEYRDCYHAA